MEDSMHAAEFVEGTTPTKPSRRRLLIGSAVAAVLVIGAVIAVIVVFVAIPNNKNNASTTSATNNNAAGDTNDPGDLVSVLATLNPSSTPSLHPTTIQPSMLPSANEPPTTTPTTSPPTNSPTTPKPSTFPSATIAPVTNAPITNAPTTSSPTTTSQSVASVPFSTNAAAEIQSGQSSNVDYYHCHNDNGSDEQIVLWHGSSFSKETWLDKGILRDFCDSPVNTVVAMDLSVGSNYQRLIQVLDAMKSDGVLDNQLPVTLVTPSASGFGVISWIMASNDVDDLPNYISTWVPVATGSLVSATDDQVSYLATLDGLEILAINGNEDSAGGKYSARLGELAGATVVELTGRHAVYLQSPEEFVDTIVDFVTK